MCINIKSADRLTKGWKRKKKQREGSFAPSRRRRKALSARWHLSPLYTIHQNGERGKKDVRFPDHSARLEIEGDVNGRYILEGRHFHGRLAVLSLPFGPRERMRNAVINLSRPATTYIQDLILGAIKKEVCLRHPPPLCCSFYPGRWSISIEFPSRPVNPPHIHTILAFVKLMVPPPPPGVDTHNTNIFRWCSSP